MSPLAETSTERAMLPVQSSPERTTRFALALVLLSPIATAAGFLSGSPLLLPLMSAAPAYVSLMLLLGRGLRARAVSIMLLWSLLLGTSMTLLCYAMPQRADGVVINGPAYWEEMSIWLETGQGRESSPRQFIPQHLVHAGIFVLLSVATASVASIAFGAVLMHYMAYYVSRVILMTPSHPILAGLLSWHPWSVVRIASFVALGVVLAEPLLSRLRGATRPYRLSRRVISLAAAGLLTDILLKAALASLWPDLLRSLRS